MLDSDTKRRIDSCRDILVGKVPDPKSQVEQITIALIYKFMDDMDAEAEEFGGERKFFAGEFGKYGWPKLIAPNMGGFDVLALYSEAIQKMNENPGVPALFRDIFKNAYLPYRDPETLRSFLKEIDGFIYDHSERLGDAFEYLLSVLGSQGEAGQFRTPRHIIDFMVEIIDPQKDESILDPACGTAGFLISSYKHILKHNSKDYRPKADHEAYDEKDVPLDMVTLDSPLHYKGDRLTPDDRKRLAANIKGYDISPDMVRLSLVNMYLHGFTDPHIVEYDTLTSEERWNDYADIILANPPFMSPKGGIKPHKRFSVQASRSEVLFVDYIAEHLSPTGRAAVVVPEGIVFQSDAAYKQLRKMLIDKGLIAVIAMPAGVFKPYASVKTHILVIDRRLAKRSDSILFVDVKNDGYSQTDTRLPISLNDIPNALRSIKSFQNYLYERESDSFHLMMENCCVVPKEEILESSNMHLIGRWYALARKFSTISKSRLPTSKLGYICYIEKGESPNMKTTPGEYPLVVPAEDKKTADHFTFEFNAVCIPMVSSSGHGKADIKRLHYQEGRFALANTMCCLRVKDEKKVNPKYLYEFLSATKDELIVPLMCGATNVTMQPSSLNDIVIPLPDIDIQKSIVDGIRLDSAIHQVERLKEQLVSELSDIASNEFEVLEKVAQSLRERKSKCHSIAGVCKELPLESLTDK